MLEITRRPAVTEPRSTYGPIRDRRPRMYVTIPEAERPALPAHEAPQSEWREYVAKLNVVRRKYLLAGLAQIGVNVVSGDLVFHARTACKCGCSPCFMFADVAQDAMLGCDDLYVAHPSEVRAPAPVVDMSWVELASR